jgi:hypothetical protein
VSEPGWYPDPAKVPGRLRYWDGQTWTDDVRDAEASAASEASAGGQRWWWAGVAVAVVIILVVVLVIWKPFDRTSAEPPLSEPTGTVSAWDDSDTPTPTPPSPTPTPPSPTPSPMEPSPTGKCEREAEARDIEPVVANGRLTVGVMSMPVPAGWDGPVSEYSTIYGAAAHGYELNVEGSWYNNLKIGPTNFIHPPSLETQARLLVACLSEGSGMSLYTSPDKMTVSKVSISGHAGVQIDAWFSWNVERLKTKGSLIRVIVVDTSDGPYYFLAEATKERSDIVSLAKKTSARLKVG